jgi:hypothetical protein
MFLAYSDPGSVPADEFHDWYDNEHLPGRLTVPGFESATRYQALDGSRPPWLAVYDIVPGTLETPEYKALYANNSDREKSILARLAALDRRVYELISDERPPSAQGGTGVAADPDPAPVLMTVSMSVQPGAEDDMNDWYVQEHIPMLLAVPGWRRARRFRLTSGDGPEWLSMHDVAGESVFDEEAYKAAATTPWRERVLQSAIGREKRIFGLYKSFR